MIFRIPDKPFLTMVALAVTLVLSSTSHADIDTKGLKLVDASGVPDGAMHAYTIQGGIIFYPTAKGGEFVTAYEKVWADGKGSWSQGSKEAKESFQISGSFSGKLIGLFRCMKDPWLVSDAGCVFISSQYAGTSGKLYDWNLILKTRGRPLSTGAVTLAAATELSKKHAAAGASPPPPPPKPQPKQEPMKIGQAQGAPGGVTASPGLVAAAAKPKLVVAEHQAIVLPNCQSPKPALNVKLTIKNAGGPLAANKGSVYVKEFGGASLSSGGVSLPAMGPGQQHTVDLPVISLQPYSSLGGHHSLQVMFTPQVEGGTQAFGHPSPPVMVTAAFPADHCKSVTRQPPGAAGNAAPPRSGIPAAPSPPARLPNR